MKNCKAIFHSVNLEQIHVNAKIMNFSGMPKCFAFWHIRGLCEKSCGIFQHQEKLFAIPEENCFAIFLGQEKLTKFFSGFELWIKPNCNSANNAEQSSARPLKTQNVFRGVANATAH